MTDNVTVQLSKEHLEWILRLAQMAGTVPLDDESRRLNMRVWTVCCDAYAGTVPDRGVLHWDEAAGLFVREASGG